MPREGRRPPCGPTPRTRGAQERRKAKEAALGSNPANTGRSSCCTVTPVHSEVQPREHGALECAVTCTRRGAGPTPRTRGAPTYAATGPGLLRSNPANTGRSSVAADPLTSRRVQPREHGALDGVVTAQGIDTGPTPRTRGALLDAGAKSAGGGSNPANTGRSSSVSISSRASRVQPREHGALHSVSLLAAAEQGPTPRTRGALAHRLGGLTIRRSNPANTGRSRTWGRGRPCREVQPREHGALDGKRVTCHCCSGPTPRTRGALKVRPLTRRRIRSNPANTGRSPCPAPQSPRPRVQPREHGALAFGTVNSTPGDGPTPRTRGAHGVGLLHL